MLALVILKQLKAIEMADRGIWTVADVCQTLGASSVQVACDVKDCEALWRRGVQWDHQSTK